MLLFFITGALKATRALLSITVVSNLAALLLQAALRVKERSWNHIVIFQVPHEEGLRGIDANQESQISIVK